MGNLVQLLLVLQEWRSLLTENPCAPGQLISLKPHICCFSFPKVLWQDKVLAWNAPSKVIH